ncbi:MAG: class I SAM-dependent methyltransferase [Candidatus Thermoplasmatota archaeon]|nr:class I SAM-dependent methyltransferase [Candidatus Thermoplasmatota archaeon]
MDNSKSDKKVHYELIRKYFIKSAVSKKGYYNSKDINEIKRDIKKRSDWSNYTSTLNKILKADKQISNAADIGCGTGDFILELVYCKQFKKIIGIDFLKETIDIAYENKQYFGNVDFIQGNMLNLPFKNRSFDLTVCLNVLHHIHEDDFALAIDELTRITDKYLMIEIRNKNNFLEFYYQKFLLPKFYKDLPQFTNSVVEVNNLMEKHGFELKIIRGRIPFVWACRRLVLVYKRC